MFQIKNIGSLPRGQRNTICDVPGVKVGHVTLADGECQTGVTAITTHDGNAFELRTRAAAHVFNGFGKSVGLVQVEELGELETPILLTNTLSVGAVSEGLIEHTLAQTPDIDLMKATINPVVFECNDAFLNKISALKVRPHHVQTALGAVSQDFEQGAVGAGRGMSCFGLKGGIGSASRRLELGNAAYYLGAVVLSNMGRLPDFTLAGQHVGPQIEAKLETDESGPEKGSIIIILGTDMPLSERQLNRVARRACVGLARTGSFLGHGSGDIALAFTTADPVDTKSRKRTHSVEQIDERRIDRVFRAAAEATEEAIINSMLNAEQVTGRDGNTRFALREFGE
ncbi:Peptidase family S58 [Pseudovibrio axinellae]|uniref:Peptidase family S58 n=1 Tax=Pseudovibrio axinellae TaxID=989403 RepID=A0A165T0G5_9HYPH|nr:P1 family peptidase [Pseudovibrio axinellae]KZL05125.1 Peptidase family S58 [Pseudovibrio axinellae]SER49133.1 D-aminopeptidase [Pseudovibrio axinellae]